MRPQRTPSQLELFQAALENIINPDHVLVKLAEQIPWEEFDETIDPCYAENVGRPGCDTRLMIGLLFLKHAFDESDESVVERWVENPYWQFFCGMTHLQHECPIDPSSLSRWRQRVGADRLEKMLEVTIAVAITPGLLKPAQTAQVKARVKYEFGCKASFVTTSKNNWILGAQALHGNPYDGHTLAGALAQSQRLTGVSITTAVVDQGYRGHQFDGDTKVHMVKNIPRKTKRALKRLLKRRSSIESTIGHLKSDNRLGRNHLKGKEGDRINAVLAAAGYNFRKLLRGLSPALKTWLLQSVRRLRSPDSLSLAT